jgi:hypothetical protein
MHQQLTQAVVQTHLDDLKRRGRNHDSGLGGFARRSRRHGSRSVGEAQSRLASTAWTRLVPAR